MKKCYPALFAFLVFSFLFSECARESTIDPALTAISGTIRDEYGPVAGAIVRIKATDNSTLSDDKGNFTLNFSSAEEPYFITAWAEGYYITGGIECEPGETNIELYLEPHSTEDNTDYQWISAFSDAGDHSNCQNCHSSGIQWGNLPFDEWNRDIHAGTSQNMRFLTMYLGTDIYGNQSPATVYTSYPEYGNIPLLPDPDLPYFGPGYKLDFPNTEGNCASCHTPMDAIDNPYGINPSTIEGVSKEGISCDFCHKILDVRLHHESNLPRDNMPGVISYEFRRPFEGHQFFSGPFDDVAPGEDVFSPVQKESQYCASCHYGSFWGVQIYNSYGEWLESSYSKDPTKLTCQDCHMPTGITDHFASLDKGGVIRDPKSIRSHRMLGIRDENFMKKAVTMETEYYFEDNDLAVVVSITNNNTGHHIPTDSPLRHLIVLVEVKDEQGNTLKQVGGPVLPYWCGIGDPNNGYFAGQPGAAYAKILREHWTQKEPTGSYWMQTRIISDNRIKAHETAISEYLFLPPKNGSISLSINLIFRRAFIELSDQKAWENEDLIIAHETMILN